MEHQHQKSNYNTYQQDRQYDRPSEVLQEYGEMSRNAANDLMMKGNKALLLSAY